MEDERLSIKFPGHKKQFLSELKRCPRFKIYICENTSGNDLS